MSRTQINPRMLLAHTVAFDSTSAGNGADTTEDTLATLTIPANTLSANGMALRVVVFGTTGGNANNKVIRARWSGAAGTVIAGGNTITFNGGLSTGVRYFGGAATSSITVMEIAA